MLDPIQQRVIGVLIEKERTVPDNYPLSENALVQGCNQKSNRDPEMSLDSIEVHPALVSLHEDGWIARVEGGGRVTKFKHRGEERLNCTRDELAVVCELLIRGPQAPGALKPRVARLGLKADADEVLEVLRRLEAKQPHALVEQLPRQAGQRDQRWRHLLGDPAERSEAHDAGEVSLETPSAPATLAPATLAPATPASVSQPIPAPRPAEDPPRSPAVDLDEQLESLEERIEERFDRRFQELEDEIRDLRQQIEQLRGS